MANSMGLMFIISSFLLLYASSQTTPQEERTCESHRRNLGPATASMHWDIRCDATGDYLPLQCTVDSPKWCACYQKEFRITQPSRSTKACDCYLQRYHAQHNATAHACDIPDCDRHGMFEKRQCCHATQKCRCVDTTTGETITQPVADTNLQCH